MMRGSEMTRDGEMTDMQNPEYQGRIDQLNATIRRQFAEYDMLMESTGVCIVKVGTGDGFPVEWCNEAAYRAIGYTKEEYEARFGYDLRGYFRGRGEPFRILTDAAEAAQKNGSPRFQALVQLPSREHAFWAQCTGTFTDIAPETGLPASVYCVFTDVTPIVETKEKLVEADRENTRLSEVLNNIPAGVCVCTVRSGIPADLTVNRYLARHLGIRSGKYDIRDMEDVYRFAHAADRISLKKALNEFFENGTALDVICRLRQEGSGSFFWVRMEGRMIGQEDETKAAFLTCTDISTLKETEKTLREAVASAKLLVWEYDIPSHTIYLADNETSEEECRRFGIERVITGVPEALAEIVDERSMPELLEMYRKVEAGENASCEIWYKRMPGREPQCERVTYTVEKDEQGRAVRAYAVGFNITAEKKVAERYTRERSFLHDNRDFNLISKGHYNLTQNQVLEYSMQAEKTPGGNYFDTHPDVTYDEAAAALLEMPCPEEDRAVLEAAVNRQSLLRRYQEGHLLSRAQYRRLQKRRETCRSG